jgi:integrase
MRRGRIFKRCGSCGARIPDRRCPRCSSETYSWAFVVDMADPGAPRRQTWKGGFKTRAEAVAGMNRLQAEKAEGRYVEPSKLTVGQYLEQWLVSVRGSGAIRGTTWKTYDVAVRVHISPRIGTIALQKLARNQVKELYQELGESGYAKGKAGPRGLSAKAVHNVHLALRKALGDAVADGLLRANPADRTHRLPADRPEMLAWSAQELRAFLASVEGKPLAALWRLAANTGMRRGEVLGTRWQDLDLETCRLAIRQQLVRSGARVVFGPPKTRAGRRLVTLDAGTVATLRAHRSRQAEERLRFGPSYSDRDLVFCRADGSPHDPDVITHQFERDVRSAGRKRIRLHDLRHTHATLLLQANVHPKVVQERLGHSSVMVTIDRYSHVVPNLQEDAATRIGAMVDGSA